MREDKRFGDGLDLLDELRHTNELLSEQIRIQKNWRIALRNGVIGGLGGVLGATVVAAALFALLRPALERIGLENLIERGSQAAAKGKLRVD